MTREDDYVDNVVARKSNMSIDSYYPFRKTVQTGRLLVFFRVPNQYLANAIEVPESETPEGVNRLDGSSSSKSTHSTFLVTTSRLPRRSRKGRRSHDSSALQRREQGLSATGVTLSVVFATLHGRARD